MYWHAFLIKLHRNAERAGETSSIFVFRNREYLKDETVLKGIIKGIFSEFAL